MRKITHKIRTLNLQIYKVEHEIDKIKKMEQKWKIETEKKNEMFVFNYTKLEARINESIQFLLSFLTKQTKFYLINIIKLV